MSNTPKDAFEGHLLIDRLLLYYSKFEGSREKASRYAQKLLDLGHIESLTNAIAFEDSRHLYRWSDANKVINEARLRSVDAKKHKETSKAVSQINGLERFSGEENGDGKAIFKILIETDNCQSAEIQANIKSSPRKNNKFLKRKVSFEPKTMTTIEEDSFFERRITKTLSYLNDERVNGEKEKMSTPYIADVSTLSKTNHSPAFEKEENYKSISNLDCTKEITKTNNHSNGVEIIEDGVTSFGTPNENEILESPRKQPFKKNRSPSEMKHAQASRMRRPDQHETDRIATGINSDEKKGYNENVSINEENRVIRLSEGKSWSGQSSTYAQKNTDNLAIVSSFDANYRQSSGRKYPPTLIASTQTSEKSILEASQLFKETRNGNGKRTPSPAPRSFRKQGEKNFFREGQCTEEQKKEVKARELQRFNEEKQKKKTRFSKEISETSIITDETLNGDTLLEESKIFNEREMSLHSTENADEAFQYKKYNGLHEGQSPIIPPPPSPSVNTAPPPSPATTTMKALFWTKISKFGSKIKNRKIFWDELVEDILVDEEEFEKMFSKPPISPQTPRVMDHFSENGRVLKILRMERSRQVGIRASSVRLPIEEINDAIINMDDDKLDLDALQAICDIRPTPEELDSIADAIKSRPNAILDKPEQFILMLAMIPSLDERLKCWIFAKKFPDKLVEIQDQLLSINDACNQIIESETLRKVLEIVLLLGNQMNKGTQRGEAYGYYLDILPKLKDVKSKKGDTNLLQYVVKVVRQQMKLEGSLDEQLTTPRGSEKSGLPEAELLHRAISVSLRDLGDELERQEAEIRKCKEEFMPAVIKESTIPAESEIFEAKFEEFFQKAMEKLKVQTQLYQDVLLTVEDFQYYFIPNSETKSKEQAYSMLRSISDFADDFRLLWSEVQKLELKEEFYKIQKYKMERKAEIQVRSTPSALKERFLSRRRRIHAPDSKLILQNPSVKKEEQSHSLSGASTPIPKRIYKFEDNNQTDKLSLNSSRNNSSDFIKVNEREEFSTSVVDRAVENSYRLEKRLRELHTIRFSGKN